MTVKLEITLPENIIEALGVGESEINSVLKRELAVYFFERNLFLVKHKNFQSCQYGIFLIF